MLKYISILLFLLYFLYRKICRDKEGLSRLDKIYIFRILLYLVVINQVFYLSILIAYKLRS